MISFTVYGVAVPQGRPRFARMGNFVRTYDPEKSRTWKESVHMQAIENRPEGGLIEGKIYLGLNFYLPRPKSLSKKVQFHIKKPDLDNLIKGVKDGLKGIIYKDDSQVVTISATKEYGDLPRVAISINW